MRVTIFITRIILCSANDLVWCMDHIGPHISVARAHPDRVRRAVARQSTDGARGYHGYRDGVHIFTFEFTNSSWGSHCAVGICGKDNLMHIDGNFSQLVNPNYLIAAILLNFFYSHIPKHQLHKLHNNFTVVNLSVLQAVIQICCFQT